VYLMSSVGVTVYRRRHAIPTGQPVSAQMTDAELAGCYEELQDVSVALRKYLERSHRLLGDHDSEHAQRGEIQRWAEQGDVWRAQWVVLGRRCRLVAGARPERHRREVEEMAAAYQELGMIQITYTDELKRFGRQLAPRLDRVKKRLERVGDHLARSPSPSGEEP
jgi:hypothetical protein